MLLISPKHIQETRNLPSSIQLNGCDIPLSTSVWNLGVTLSQIPSFQQYVSHVRLATSSSVKSGHMQERNMELGFLSV